MDQKRLHGLPAISAAVKEILDRASYNEGNSFHGQLAEEHYFLALGHLEHALGQLRMAMLHESHE